LRPRKQTTSDQTVAPGGDDAPAAAVRLADALLVRRVQAGEVHAFTELVRKYQDRVFNACLRICGRREDAADLTQEAFLKAFSAIDEFRGASAFYTWIFRIAVNLSISHQRKERHRRTASIDDPGGSGDADFRMPASADADPSDAIAAQETRAQVAAALATLDAEHRAAIVLRDIEGCDYQEIADILELPIGTVKSRIFRGRLALRRQLEPVERQPAKKR